ncbi:16S rRNA (cytidine(1402)-2'-O)-methyltransferase [Evansella sp. LMS18]|uniref:16S rRNA (cytidine(1402)-2'-O)-methyltransferase n=1 Tax=Evansella sp. LMS18 TaxID=2924033 RepID=UPI0020D0BB15|nr:16S rRNA (cytidine(1402)-2'-O)-methyltransferase [Evansella sp. LMS18]UTR12429.1 16S rRNA (cytidine(1402)-2'-O)-methyltransferase [Evansella sp. LMS18]
MIKVQIQQSYRDMEGKGCLYLVPTPIGNLQDMTYRAVEILKSADIIAAEDTRHTKKLCHAFSIETPLISYHEHNKLERENMLVDKAKGGEVIALVSDAGMPAISDPGADLAARFAAEEIPVIALPGANAALTALVVSAQPTESFTFAGFLDRRKKEREKALEKWKRYPDTLIFYEAPHRLKETLTAILKAMGNRDMALCREITKQYETILRGKVESILAFIEEEGVKGECVLVISGASEEEQMEQEEEKWWASMTIEEHIEHYIGDGLSSKDAIKQTAADRKMKKRDVYQVYHVD